MMAGCRLLHMHCVAVLCVVGAGRVAVVGVDLVSGVSSMHDDHACQGPMSAYVGGIWGVPSMARVGSKPELRCM